jgi:flagellar hook protein FlgE
MVRSLTSAVSGIQQFQQRMDVIGNNIANVNTVAFKSGRTNLADSFSQTLATSNLSGDAAAQIGLGVITSGIYNSYTQGAINRTGVETDLAVAGDGFFVVRDALSGNTFVTRAGDFRLDNDGYLITNGGLRVQGYNDIGLTTIGDIQIDASQRPATVDPTADMVSFAIDGIGRVGLRMSDGSEFVRAQILMQRFTNPQGLVKEGNNLYSGIGSAGPLGGAATPTPAAPGSSGLGRIQSGALELSNVDLSNEFSQLIQTQRAFQANARIMTTSDEMLQELVNIKR